MKKTPNDYVIQALGLANVKKAIRLISTRIRQAQKLAEGCIEVGVSDQEPRAVAADLEIARATLVAWLGPQAKIPAVDPAVKQARRDRFNELRRARRARTRAEELKAKNKKLAKKPVKKPVKKARKAGGMK